MRPTELASVSISTPGRSGQQRIPELDGLRGTAILMVIAFHYLTEQGSVTSGAITPVLQRLVLMGWSGVDLFFVLSGFLIGGILVDARHSPSYFKAFYTRRFFRIIPIYYLWILAYILLLTLAGQALRARSNSGEIMQVGLPIYAHFLFLQNMLIIPFAGIAGAWFAHLWSLAVEEQFYLVSPLVVRMVSPRYLAIVLACVIGAAPLLRIYLLAEHMDAGLVSSLTPCRADSLAMGMLAAVLWRRDEFRAWLEAHSGVVYAILGVLFAGVMALWKWVPESRMYGMETLGYTWLAAFFAVVLLLVMLRREGPLAWLARMRWLRELGRVSYCAYIIHLVVNVICHSFLRHAPPATTDLRGAAVTLFAAFATYAIAWISWKVLEGPLMKVGHSFKY